MNKVMVKIHGAEYPMVGDKSEKFMISIADFVDKEMDKITRQNPKLSLSVAAILTALNISDLLFECSDENEKLIKANEELSKKVGASNEELQLEIKSLKLTIAEKEAENREAETKMKELIEIIENKKQEIFELSNTTEGSRAELDVYKNKIEELSTQLEEANERATIAENLASEFQNKAYDLQLKCTGLNNDAKKIGNNVILDDISLVVETGTLVVLIGSSGCGKTTTLKLINKLIKPTSGEIYINGKPISQENEIELRRKIGYVIQNTGLFPHLTIKENIELIPRLKKEKSVEEIEKRTLQLLEMVGLDSDEFLNKYPSELSGGQQQRIGVARAIATDAEIILMDEPFSALDPITRTSLQEQLFSLQDELKKTIIFVTHNTNFISYL